MLRRTKIFTVTFDKFNFFQFFFKKQTNILLNVDVLINQIKSLTYNI